MKSKAEIKVGENEYQVDINGRNSKEFYKERNNLQAIADGKKKLDISKIEDYRHNLRVEMQKNGY